MMIIEVEVDSRRWRGLALFLDVRQRMPSLADPRALCMGVVKKPHSLLLYREKTVA
jgi:hypothetical protein